MKDVRNVATQTSVRESQFEKQVLQALSDMKEKIDRLEVKLAEANRVGRVGGLVRTRKKEERTDTHRHVTVSSIFLIINFNVGF